MGWEERYEGKIRFKNDTPSDQYTDTPEGTVVPSSFREGRADGQHIIKVNKCEMTEDGIKVTPDGEVISTKVQQTSTPAPQIKKTRRGKKAERDLDALFEEEEPTVPFQQPSPPPARPLIKVTLTGFFGKVVIPVKDAIEAELCVVLVSDSREGFSYSPPESPEPFSLTMPDGVRKSVTYMGLEYDMPTGEKHVIFLKAEQ